MKFKLCNGLIVLIYFFSFSYVAGQGRLSDAGIERDTLIAKQLMEKEKELIQNGKYQTAVDNAVKAQSLYTKHELWEEAVQCAIRLSKIADYFDAPDKKVKYSDLSLRLSEKHLSSDHPLLAAALRQKAEGMMQIEKSDSANYFLTRAVPLFDKHQEWVDLGWTEILLAVNFYYQYQLDSCILHLKNAEGLVNDQKLPKEDEAEIQSSLLNLYGVVYNLQGDYNKAIDNTQKALSIALSQSAYSAMDSSIISGHYNNLGFFYITKGDHQRALDNFVQAMNSYKNASSDHELLFNIGESLMRQKKYSEAIEYFHQCHQLTKGRTDRIRSRMDLFVSLGATFRNMNALDSALYYCQKAVDLPTSYNKYLAWSLMGDISIKKNKAVSAIEQIDKALTIYKKDSTAQKSKPLFLSRMYKLVGDGHVLNKDRSTALNFYQKALIVNHSNFKDSLHLESNPPLTGVYDPVYFLSALHAKAKTQALFIEQTEQQKAALISYQLAIQWIDTLQKSYVTETAQLDWSATFKPIYEGAIQVAFRLHQSTKDSKYIELAFIFSERSKNAILLKALKSKEGQGLAAVPDSLIKREKDLNLDIAFYEKSLQKSQKEKEAKKEQLYQQYLSKSRLELSALKEQMEQEYPNFQKWKYGETAISTTTVQSKILDDKTAFLEYFIGDNSVYVFVITQRSVDFLALVAPSEIEMAVENFRALLLDPGSFERHAKKAIVNYYQQATSTYSIVLQKPIEVLPADIQQLIIVPDGALNAVPFEALCKTAEIDPGFDFAQLPYILYDYQLNYAYSANLLLKNINQLERLPANTNCLAFAPPYQGGQQIAQRGDLEKLRNMTGQLEGTAREVQQIAHFIEGQFNFDKSATEKQFKTQAGQFGILHLAMHGVLDSDNANFNHLKFSNFKSDVSTDNLLHQYEIENMNLNAQLVVLSACETGVGKYEKGEGVYSLARSFMYSGVPSVIMSLWKVSDASTSQLMPLFYEKLKTGKSKAKSLQLAKTQYLKEANVEFRHPFYWSAFVIMGDAKKLKSNKSNVLWWSIGIMLSLLLIRFFWKKSRTQIL